MFLDAFTCCVGPVYAGYLARSIGDWTDGLDSLTVVTRRGDADVLAVCRGRPRVRVLETDVFTAHGAFFNKGAALVQAYALMRPIDAVLHFDSDIHPPGGWRQLAESRFRPGTIAGARRVNEDGSRIEDLGPWPYGYFQMWHADDPAVQYWPIFEVWHPHCGSYDLEFLEKWPRQSWADLGFQVVHYGEVRQNWFGVGLPSAEQEASFSRMKRLHQIGLRNVRMQARDPKNRLKVPPFGVKIAIPKSLDPQRARALLRACMADDPFLVSARLGDAPGHHRVRPKTTEEDIRAMIAEHTR